MFGGHHREHNDERESKCWTVRRQTELELIQVNKAVVTPAGPTTCRRLRSKTGAITVKMALKISQCANPQSVRDHYERQLKALQEAYGEAMLELSV